MTAESGDLLPAPDQLRYRVLGPLMVVDGTGRTIELGAHKVRSLLCALLASPGQTVSVDRLISFLWGDEPPAASTATLQAYVSQLRRLLEPSRGPRQPATVLVTRPPGYALVLAPGALDSDELGRLVELGEAQLAGGHADVAVTTFSDALALRRGTPFADVADEPFAVGVIAKLEQLFLVAAERRVDAFIASGRIGAATAELERLVTEHPLLERFWAQYIESLYRGGRQADALRAFQACRDRLIDELGVEPSQGLRELERIVLAQEPLPAAAMAVMAVAPLAHRPGRAAVADQEPQDSDHHPGELLIGRVPERAVIERVLAAARRGDGSILSIEGEAGIGKSRLAQAAIDAATTAGLATAWVTCLDVAGTPILWPWEEAVRALGRRVPPPPNEPDPDIARFQRVVGLLDVVIDLAREQPVALVIDDAQWADAASLQALRILVRRLKGARLLVILTVRRPDVDASSGVDDLLAEFSRQRDVERFRLAGLSTDEVGQLMEGIAGDIVDAVLVDAVASRTGGNPFFIAETARLMLSEHELDRTPTHATLSEVPQTVREVVDRRLARLPEDTQAVLRLMSLAGPTVTLDVLEEASALPAERLIALSEVAVLSGLLIEDEDSIGWRFAHALVRDAVRAGISQAGRARLHRTLADAIEHVHGDDIDLHLADLARHSIGAAALGRKDAALAWSTRAALQARTEGAFDTAVRFWRGALGVLDARQRRSAERFDLLVRLAHDLRSSGDTVGFGEVIDEAIGVATDLRDRRRIALAAAELGWVNLWNTRAYGAINEATCLEIERLAEAEPDPALAARLFGAVAVELYYGDRRAHGEMLAGRAVEIARTVGDPSLIGRALNNFVLATWVPQRDPDRLAACNESLRHAGRGLPAQTEAVARLHRAALNLRLAEIALVEADLAQCRNLSVEIGFPEITAQVQYAECGLHIMRGDWARAEALAEEAYETHARTNLWGAQWCRSVQLICIREGQGRVGDVAEQAVRAASDPSLMPLRATAVMAVAEAGDLTEARRLAALWDWRTEPIDWSWDQRMADWAEAAALIGTLGSSDIYDQLQPYADTLRVSGTGVACRGSMHGVLGRLAEQIGEHDAGRAHRERAAAVNAAAGATVWTRPTPA